MKKLFAFFWDKSLLIFAIIGAVNTVITMVGTQLLMGPFTNSVSYTHLTLPTNREV